MANLQVERVLGQLRRIAQAADGRPSDGQLLVEFISRRAESAFEDIVRRHGPMVLGVCRRVLRDAGAAEDAFQATFLVLVRKAGSIADRELLGHWLYRVAYHLALRAKAVSNRRQLAERQVRSMPSPECTPDANAADLQAVLDQELNDLPEKYRAPLVLCDLQGRTRKEVAGRLGWPEGTLSSRLNRGRELLRQRLGRRGLTLTLGALAAALGPAAAAAVPPLLRQSTVCAAMFWAANHELAATAVSAHVAALTEGMVKAMFVSKLSLFAGCLFALGLVGVGAGALVQHSWAGGESEAAQPATPPDKPKAEAPAIPAVAPKEVQRWIDQLRSAKFTERQQAAEQLEKLGPAALPALRQAAADGGELDFRLRVDQLIAAIEAKLWADLDKPRQAIRTRLGQVLATLPGLEDSRLVEVVYLLTLARSPTEAEARAAANQLKQTAANRPETVYRLAWVLVQDRAFNADVAEINIELLELQKELAKEDARTLARLLVANPLANKLVERIAGKLLKNMQTDRQRLDLAFLLMLSRLPENSESSNIEKRLKAAPNRDQALGDVLWALLNSAEFLANPTK